MTSDEFNALVNNLKTQDNLATKDPVFCVKQKKRIYGILSEYHTEGYIWKEVGGEIAGESDEELREYIIEHEYLSKEDTANLYIDQYSDELEIDSKDKDEDGDAIVCVFERIYYIEYEETAAVHFTRAAAENYLKINGHNLVKPFIYVEGQFRCHEWNSVREAIMSGQLVLKNEE